MNLLALDTETGTKSAASLAAHGGTMVPIMWDNIADDWTEAGVEVGMTDMWSDGSNRKLVVSEWRSRKEDSLSERSEEETLLTIGRTGLRTMQTIDMLRLMRSR